MIIREKNKMLVLLIAFLFCLSALGWIFITNIRTLLVHDAKTNLEKVTLNIVDSLLLGLDTRTDILNALLHIPEINSPNLSLEKKIELIKHESELKTFVRVGIADTNGRALTSDGSTVFIGDRSYYQTALAGKPAISELINSRISQEDQIIAQAMPIFDEKGKVINVLFAVDKASNMTNSITNIHYSLDAHVTLTDSRGLIISQSQQGESINALNLLDYLSERQPSLVDDINTSLLNNQMQTVTCEVLNHQYYMTYAPLKFQNISWLVFVGVPVDSVLAPSKAILTYTALLVMGIILTLALLFTYIYNMRKKYISELKVSEYRYKIITEYTDNIVLDWNIVSKTIYFSKSWYNKFSHSPPGDLANYSFPNVYTDDVGTMKTAIANILQGIQPDEFEIRVLNKHANILWLNVHLTLISDENARPYRVIGILVDITEKKLKELEIRDKAERDALSALYNRHTFEEKAMVEFSKAKTLGTSLAFLFIDIDDFRYFNNNLGHAFGDRVITFIGDNLIEFTNGIGFAGRIGGDEFAACITAADSIEHIELLVAQFQQTLKDGLPVRESDVKVQVGSSIGIITMPYPADSYQELIKKADDAMYHVKANGKGSYMRIDPPV